MNEILTPILVKLILSIVTVIVPILANQALKVLKAKSLELEHKLGEQKYNTLMKIADDVYHAVEQEFKLGIVKNKQRAFDNKIISKIPGLTQEDLDIARESVVGRINLNTK